MDNQRIAEWFLKKVRDHSGCVVDGVTIYDEPLVAFGAADDPMFLTLKSPEVVGPWHKTPEEWLPGAKTVISVFFPFSEQVRVSNRTEGKEPSLGWLYARYEGQEFISRLLQDLCQWLREEGVGACAPSEEERFVSKIDRDAGIFSSNWSERHCAYICGLGTFGLSKGLITEKGIAGRFGSVIVDIPLEITPRRYTDIYEYCIRCGVCAQRCPVQAISLQEGKDHLPCNKLVAESKKIYAPRYGCGKCQTAVPCEDRNPSL